MKTPQKEGTNIYAPNGNYRTKEYNKQVKKLLNGVMSYFDMEGDGELETESVELSNLKNIIKND